MTYTVDFPEPGVAVEWSLTESGVMRTEQDYEPTWYVAANGNGDLKTVSEAFRNHPAVTDLAWERHRPGWRHDATEVLRVDVSSLSAITRLASSVAQQGRPGDVRCFNVDLSPQFRYCLETETDPTPARTPTRLRLDAPVTTFSDGLSELTVEWSDRGESRTIEGEPAEIARQVETSVRDTDPDVLVLSTAKLVPTLFEAAEATDYQLGRESGYTQLAGESTFESYGRVGHSPARYKVPGRAILDEANTFFLTESNLDGLLDLTRRSHKPLQETGWASIGNVLTAIQIRKAMAEGVLVPWRAWRPEHFKSARTLELADRGGFTFSPEVGLHEDVHELDFSSLYPNIMCTRNISPETVCCECHPDRADVPGLGYSICPEDGYLPEVLQPLIDDRDAIKAEIAETEDEARLRELNGKSSAIKWILVSCFGYQGFSNAKFGRIECHEAINAFAREIILDAKECLERHGWRVIHGIVDSLWVTSIEGCTATPLEKVVQEVTDLVGVRLEYEAAYDWIAFCPRRSDEVGALTRYFGKQAGEPMGEASSYKRRGIEARQRSTPPFIKQTQLALMQELGQTQDPDTVCTRLQAAIDRVRREAVDPSELAIRNRVSKPLEEYTHSTRNVAALQRASDADLSKAPGQDVEYVVVDDDKDGRDRVALIHEAPTAYDTEFYRDSLIRAAASLLSVLGVREPEIRQRLSERVDTTLGSF